MRLAAGFRPDPLGELERSTRSPSRNWGCLLLREKGWEGEKRRKGMGRGREEGKGKGEREGEGRFASHTIFMPWNHDALPPPRALLPVPLLPRYKRKSLASAMQPERARE